MIVRRLAVDEWKITREIRLDALRGSPRGTFATTYDIAAEWTDEQWRDWHRGRELFVAELDRSPVGCAGLIIQEGLPVLVSMWVNPVARGTGASDHLIDAVIARARETGHRELRLWVLKDNRHAEKLYERKGFVFTGRDQPSRMNNPRREREMIIDVA
ncbi:GNAT family N-acetyltransferase [Nocardia arthritidis]|uniref:GNAT family N-acetyltransferase n=1 Tax=Nocardia arthritidis TaxID=228602 RepID=A0A6G9YCN3_9NOCA|nr:GNAT family N-acetyltransferase [Nocardia arthritidis]QIS10816.1 GNAT family N-acetyltransferase [Nocardia arthritidis]